MPQILIRAHKNPFTVADADTTYRQNLIGNNTGNLVFSQAVYRLLSAAGADVETSGLARSHPRVINSRFDHVVIPLANAFRSTYLETLDALSNLIEQLSIPVTVLGVGSQASLKGVYKGADTVDPATTRFVRAVLNRSPSIGVRGDHTRDYLKSLGFGDEHVKVIGCPSMFMYGPNLKVEKKVESLSYDSPIAFNVSPYVPEMGPLSLYAAEHFPNLVYMAQNIQTLELMLYGSYPKGKRMNAMAASGAPITLEHPLIRSDRVRFFLDPKTWFEHLAEYDFSFGTRIHGNIAALLAGTPALLLAHDSRTLELAEYHEIPHRTITSIEDDADPLSLYAECDWNRLNKAHPDRWDSFASFLGEHRLTNVYDDGQDPSDFDSRLAATEFPPPVRTLMGFSPEELYEMRRTVTDLGRELNIAHNDLNGTSKRTRPRKLHQRAWNRIDRAVRSLSLMA
ncbi:MAG TPA: polysaccharide pyruvyl transferase family protein [Propionibacteriaceae bacterium]|nr:polysaccharide pyruvyl transferase family protein [Propionibacteriaceae bacterium]